MMQISCDYVVESENGDDLFSGASLDLSTGIIETDSEGPESSLISVKSYMVLKGVRFDLTNIEGISHVNAIDIPAISKLAMRGARL